MLDRFVIGRVSRISPEAPVPVVGVRPRGVPAGRRRQRGAQPARARRGGGPGRRGRRRRGGRAAEGASWPRRASTRPASSPIPTRRTTTKMRVVTTRNQQVARIDYESDHDATPRSKTRVGAQVATRASSRAGASWSPTTRRASSPAASMAQWWRLRASRRHPGDGRSQGAAHRLLPRRHAGHAQPRRGRERHQHAHRHARGRAARPREALRQRLRRGERAHHAGRTRHVAVARRARTATCPRRPARWPTSPARATP